MYVWLVAKRVRQRDRRRRWRGRVGGNALADQRPVRHRRPRRRRRRHGCAAHARLQIVARRLCVQRPRGGPRRKRRPACAKAPMPTGEAGERRAPRSSALRVDGERSRPLAPHARHRGLPSPARAASSAASCAAPLPADTRAAETKAKEGPEPACAPCVRLGRALAAVAGQVRQVPQDKLIRPSRAATDRNDSRVGAACATQARPRVTTAWWVSRVPSRRRCCRPGKAVLVMDALAVRARRCCGPGTASFGRIKGKPVGAVVCRRPLLRAHRSQHKDAGRRVRGPADQPRRGQERAHRLRQGAAVPTRVISLRQVARLRGSL